MSDLTWASTNSFVVPFVADAIEHVANRAVCGLGAAQLTLISAESLDRILCGAHSGSL